MKLFCVKTRFSLNFVEISADCEKKQITQIIEHESITLLSYINTYLNYFYVDFFLNISP